MKKIEFIKQYIKEAIDQSIGARNLIKTISWNIDSIGNDSYKDGYSGDDTETFTDDFTISNLIEILESQGIVNSKMESVILLPDFLDSNIYTEKGLLTIDIDFINTNIKSNTKLMKYLISEIEREISVQIKTNNDFTNAIKLLIKKYDGGPIWLLLEFLENKKLPEYKLLYNKYCIKLFKGLYQFKYELNINSILNQYMDEYVNQYDYNQFRD